MQTDMPCTKVMKPRSVKTDQNALSSVFRSLGNSWNLRYVWSFKNEVFYGPKPNEVKEKVAYESISKCEPINPSEMKSLGCPEKFLECGWSLVSDDKTLHWACETVSERDKWVQHLRNVIVQFSPECAAARRHTLSPQHNSTHSLSQMSPDESAHDGGGDDDLDDYAAGSPKRVKTANELKSLVGGDDDDDFSSPRHEDMRDEEDDDSEDDPENDEEMMKDLMLGNSGSVKDERETMLMKIAEAPYHHLPNKTRDFIGQFKHEEPDSDIQFSRTIAKIGKRDTSQVRDIVITSKSVYLFSQSSMVTALLSNVQCRAFGLEHVVGVVESTVETNLFAILMPSYHDLLLRIVPQRSAIAGGDEDVKLQLIAHLFKATNKINRDRPFIFRKNEAIRRCIRRSEDDKHLPLDSTPKDKLKVGVNPGLYPMLRINADSRVFVSASIVRVTGKMERQPRVLAITDIAIYILSDTSISRRTGYTELGACFYDSDQRYILLKARPCDVLVQAKTDDDFNLIIATLPDVYSMQMKRDLIQKAKSESQLLSLANLVQKEASALNAEGILKGMKVTQKLLRKAGRQVFSGSAAGIGGILKIGEKGLNLGVGLVKTGVGAAGDLIETTGPRNNVVFPWDFQSDDNDGVVIEPTHDLLKLVELNMPSLVQQGIDHLVFSGKGQKYHLPRTLGGIQIGGAFATEDIRRSEKMFIVSDNAFYIFHDPNDAQNIASQMASAALTLFTKRTRFSHDNTIKFSELVGLCFCKRERNLFALLCNDEQGHDFMLRIPSLKQTRILFGVLTREYYKHKGVHLPVSYTETSDDLKMVCRKTKLDVTPQVAMETTEQDFLEVAKTDHLIERLRRYGDTKVFFSNAVKRPKTATMKSILGGNINEFGEAMADGLGDAAGAITNAFTGILGKEKKLKAEKKTAFLLIITNCALHQCTRDWQIQRRIEIRDVGGIFVEKDDPDSLMISVPTEYDFIVCCNSRSRELCDRMQDAYLFWTNFAIYERLTKNPGNDYRFPITVVPSLFKVGKFEKPKGFSEQQASKKSETQRLTYQKWTLDRLSRAIRLQYDPDVAEIDKPVEEAAHDGGDDMLESSMSHLGGSFANELVVRDRAASYTPSITVTGKPMMIESDAWLAQQWLNDKHTVILDVEIRRARATEFPERVEAFKMAVATQQQCLNRTSVAAKLRLSLENEDSVAYEKLKEEAEDIGLLDDLLDDLAPCFDYVRRKRELIEEIRSEIEFESSVSEAEISKGDTPLVTMFERASSMGVSKSELSKLRTQFDQRVQKEVLLTHLAERVESQMDAFKHRLMAKVSTSLGADIQVKPVVRRQASVIPDLSVTVSGTRRQTFSSVSEMAPKEAPPKIDVSSRAIRMLDLAFESGHIRKIEEAVEFARGVPNPPQHLVRSLQAGERELADTDARHRLCTTLSSLLAERYEAGSISMEKLEEMEKSAQALVKEAQEFKGLRTLTLQASVRVERFRSDIAFKQNMRNIEMQDERVRVELEKEKRLRVMMRGDATAKARLRMEAESRRREDEVLTALLGRASIMQTHMTQVVQEGDMGNVRTTITESRSLMDQLTALNMTTNPKTAEIEGVLKDVLAVGSAMLASLAKATQSAAFAEAEKLAMDNNKNGLIAHIQSHHATWNVTELARIKAVW